MRILFDSKKKEFKKPFGCITPNHICTICIKIPKHCETNETHLCIDYENNLPYKSFKMEKNIAFIDDDYDEFVCKFSLSEKGLFFYYFKITAVTSTFKLFRQGLNDTNMETGDLWQLSCISECRRSTKDFFGKVMYQIFPDRFNKVGDCDLTEKIKPFILHKNRDEIPNFAPDVNGIVQNNDFYGGNLNGITDKLSYLKSLSVSIIYLNPIFMAYSNHRYDTANYKKIDPILGTEQDFKLLCEEAHKLDMKIILDGVFSHTGEVSEYFDVNDTFGNGCYHHENSPYKEWYQFKKYPDDYESWWGIRCLPCVNELNESFMNYILNAEDSVVAKWLNLGADGFRLDVADELPDEFIARLHERVHEIKPESIVIGEVWEDASNKIAYSVRRKYFVDGELDSVMNYPFQNAISDFVLEKMDALDFMKVITTVEENYPPNVVACLMNSLSTHDTVRVLTKLGIQRVPPEKSTRAIYKLNDYELNLGLLREKAAALLQFTLPGNPCIYYGDEIGMQGFEDPFCRLYFDWENKNEDLLSFYKKLSSTRANSTQLRLGKITFDETLPANIISFKRILKGRCIRVILSLADNFSILADDEDILFSTGVSCENKKIVFKKYSGIIISEKINE